MITQIAFGAILFLVHYFSGSIHVRHRAALLSFSVGVSLSYVFLYLIPESVSLAVNQNTVFTLVLAGLTAMRIIEGHAKKHRSAPLARRELRNIHTAGFAAYGLLMGIIISGLYSISPKAGFLLFFASLFHSVAGSASMAGIHESVTKSGAARALLSAPPLLGIAANILVPIQINLLSAALGGIIGVMLYVVMRDMMPAESKGRPGYFVGGILAFYALMTFVFAVF